MTPGLPGHNPVVLFSAFRLFLQQQQLFALVGTEAARDASTRRSRLFLSRVTASDLRLPTSLQTEHNPGRTKGAEDENQSQPMQAGMARRDGGDIFSSPLRKQLPAREAPSRRDVEDV